MYDFEEAKQKWESIDGYRFADKDSERQYFFNAGRTITVNCKEIECHQYEEGEACLYEACDASKMFHELGRKLVSRILAADALGDTTDVEARLISIIAERDVLKSRHWIG